MFHLFFDSRIEEGSLPIINDRNVDRMLYVCVYMCHPKLSKYKEPVVFDFFYFVKLDFYHISAFSTINNYMTRENLILWSCLRYIKWFCSWDPLKPPCKWLVL